jgi:stearoyl-CoA desaturase (Delta-9 desaturase)
MKNTDRPLDWGNILFLTLSPLIALIGGLWYTHQNGVSALEITMLIAMGLATGLSITGGYHRHFSHVSYQAHPAIRQFFLVFGACAMQNSALNWAADHRLHHRFTDTEKDPYNAGQGFWWSHMGWIFYKTPATRDFSLVADLYKDKWVRWQHEHCVAIGVVVGLGLPLLLGFAVGRPIGMLLWAGVIRVVLVHHATFFINSLAHMWGKQPYSRDDSSVDSWWLAFLTNGEGYHNFHHKFPSDYRNGIHWYQWDPTKWLIAGLNRLGMTDRLHRIPPHLILRARLEVEALEAERQLQGIALPAAAALREKLDMAWQRLDHAVMQWGEGRARYWDAKKAKWKDSELIAQCKVKARECEQALSEAREQWREFVRGLQRIPA